ncbi:MAG: hypothetical protein WC342_02180 [Methanoregula sp.]|jgi:uncharacterized BrkB/YihY/UPF0761 family membrane protein
MEVPGIRTWIIFYLLSFVVLLWAAFLTVTGEMLWVSLMLIIIIIGVNFVIVYKQFRTQAARQNLQNEFTKNLSNSDDEENDPDIFRR